ncbi:rRNA pseudouridine synthase [Lysobacter pythonis]|uniref:Pseudouridine synthase n=1 Tax=Solilutibacter pythonis TaxID=2483112 RepID=A0A3M2HUY3_9GAMM|nr:pseudouridine synthase [Lysobacter pythonis]RMH93546.1 rRNA pseudouridine synthase [Lysobacter pythonis]
MKPIVSGRRRVGLARVLSKRGVCSRSQAAAMVRDGRVVVRGRVVRDPESPTLETEDAISIDGQPLAPPVACWLMLNKPRGLLTTVCDERGRDTVYRCFEGAGLGWIAPVGRLDKASEGLLLFSNDPEWAARITDPERGPDKTYHVQVAGIPGAAELRRMHEGIDDAGECLRVASASLLRRGDRNAWLEIVLDEGRNRQIRRLLTGLDFEVLRLVRVAVGPLRLGDLGKGEWRELAHDEAMSLFV